MVIEFKNYRNVLSAKTGFMKTCKFDIIRLYTFAISQIYEKWYTLYRFWKYFREFEIHFFKLNGRYDVIPIFFIIRYVILYVNNVLYVVVEYRILRKHFDAFVNLLALFKEFHMHHKRGRTVGRRQMVWR